MDQRYKGIAQGVGQTEILGRIHVAPIKVSTAKDSFPYTMMLIPFVLLWFLQKKLKVM